MWKIGLPASVWVVAQPLALCGYGVWQPISDCAIVAVSCLLYLRAIWTATRASTR